ncbi:peptidoglycan editing factor PgeF [Pseudolabrys taiwanensis]|uniref:Purine nucleoside phosphorylase n=1 Tax=Pseudolabrys taiwanensis TaxID=331696 RepID=A0A346A4V2_9HYPH|nr:peptidoglycan editing factor PgeF [Pseudolabrys taiwanensis]AXK84199.1 peptidoglycan editing factor PgeF [Pseudolabrys taiwanensis]
MIQAPTLTQLPRIRHAFFTRDGGISEGIYASLNGGVGSNDAPERVAENRARMAAALGVAPNHLITPYQIHSAEVAVADAPWTAETRPRADAVVTRKPGLAIGVSTADCGPLLFADADAGVIGAAHAGWRGAFTGVIEATLAEMEKLGADRSRIVAALGPTISRPNYEVGPEFVERFLAADVDNARFFTDSERPGHAMFDLKSYIADRMARAGVGNFTDLGLCTYAEPDRFYSYRRTTQRGEPDYGRHINAIALGE